MCFFIITYYNVSDSEPFNEMIRHKGKEVVTDFLINRGGGGGGLLMTYYLVHAHCELNI